MVQATGGAPTEGGAVVPAQSNVPNFPALPVSQILPQPQIPQMFPEGGAQQLFPEPALQMYPESTAQLYGDASAQLHTDPTAQLFTDPKSQLYPEASSQMFTESAAQQLFPDTTSQLYPEAASQLFPEANPQLYTAASGQLYTDATPQFYTDPKSQLYPETVPQFYPESTSQFYPVAVPQTFADTLSQIFTDTAPQLYTDNTAQVATNPFTAPDQFVTPVDNFQCPTLNSASTTGELAFPSTFTAFGPVDNMPTTRLDNVVSSELVPESNNTDTTTTSGDICLDNNSFDAVSNSAFQAIPVVDVQDFSTVDNAAALTDTRADSVDSLNSKSYTSDASDVYMNSDYTDTLTSVTSTTLLLEVQKYNEQDDLIPQADVVPEIPAAEPATETQSEAFYTNKAFAVSGVSLTKVFKPENSNGRHESIPEEQEEKEENENETHNWVIAHNSSIYEKEQTQTSGDKEDGGDLFETERILHEAPDCVEELVHQLAEQHPSDVVELHVEIVEEPVYQPLTHPIWEEEEGWMNSTESLHHYKLMKQGRAGTMFNLHEQQSFLNLTAASVTSLGQVCQKALQYVRADMEFGSMMSLGLADGKHPSQLSLGSGKGQPPSDLEALNAMMKKNMEPSVASGRHTRNLIYISLMATILLVSINACRNLQSSLNQEGGVGITSLAISFTFYTLGSPISPIVVQRLGVRGSITFGLVLQLIYVATNLHPVMWLMAPSSAGAGASLAIIWNAVSTYIVLLARGESNYRDKVYERVSDRYFGIFCLIYQCNLVVGNLIASLILTFGDSAGSETAALLLNSTGLNSTTANLTDSIVPHELLAAQNLFLPRKESADPVGLESGSDFRLDANTTALDPSTQTHYHLCGAAFCHHFEISQDSSGVSERTKYLLFGIFMFLIVLTILIAVFLMEPLCIRISALASTPWQTVKRQMVSLARFSRNRKFLLLLPLLFYSNMQFSFVCSEVTMAFVTCPVGVWMVGYTMMCYGVWCGLASYLTQALIPRTGRFFFIALASLINVVLLMFMRFWQPHPDQVEPLFVITGLLGFADGIWNVNANGLMGSVFKEHYEEAFTGLRMAQGLGGALNMAYSPFLCMAVKIYIMLGATVTVFLGYIGAEMLIRRDRRHKSVFLAEKEVV